MKNLTLSLILLISFYYRSFSQEINADNITAFHKASFLYEKNFESPIEIRFQQNLYINEDDFFKGYKKYFDLSDDFDFILIKKTTDQLGQTHEKYCEYYKGVEIIGAQIILHEKNGYIHFANGHLVHNLILQVTPLFNKEDALQYALRFIGAESYMWENESNENFIKKKQQDPNTTYFPEGKIKLTSGTEQLKGNNIRLIYRFDIYAEYPLSRNFVDVDANTGEIINVVSRIMDNDVPGSGVSLYNGLVQFTADEVIQDTIYRLQEHSTRSAFIESYDMQNGYNYNSAVDIISPSANGPWDSAGVNAHFGAESTFDYYFIDHGRNGLDDAGFPMRNYIHANLIGLGFEDNINAFWDGEKVTYGDGDGINYFPLVATDVVGHEFTHGVTEFSANLIYQAESGALNESFSDIFGNLVEFMVEGNPGAGTGSWRMGEDCNVSGSGIRNMADPNEFDDPDTYQGNFWAPLNGPDNGGVHTNSGVQNYWFYLLSEGGSGVNDNGYNYNVTGIGLTDAAKIAYRNLTAYLVPSSIYVDARLASINSAVDLFGDNSQQFFSVQEAWSAVGVYYPTYEQSIGVSSDTLQMYAEYPQGKSARILQIINQGLDTLIIDSISISGNDFDIVESPVLPYSLNEFQDNFSIKVEFTAYTQGTITETLNIFSNDPNYQVKSVILNGYGYTINPVIDTTFYASSGGETNGSILLLDKITGEGTLLGSTDFSIINNLAVNPNTGQLYGVITGVTQSSIVKINATDGAAYNILNLNLAYMSIAFDTSGNLFAGLRTGEIYTINVSDGTYNLLTTTTIPINTIAFNPFTNELWAAPKYVLGNNKDKIYKVNILTGEAIEIGKTGLNEITNDLAFDEQGILYGVVGLPLFVGKLIKIDTTNALATVIGETGFEDVQGLAYYPGTIVSVPILSDILPDQYCLMQNYPNPFNPSTRIKYSIPQTSQVEIKVFDVLGKEIETLVNEEKPAGNYEINFNASDLASGVYFYQLIAVDPSTGSEKAFVETKKMVLLR